MLTINLMQTLVQPFETSHMLHKIANQRQRKLCSASKVCSISSCTCILPQIWKQSVQGPCDEVVYKAIAGSCEGTFM